VNMNASRRRRPLLASVICFCVLVVSGPALLRALHVIPPLRSFPAPTDHVSLHHVLSILEPTLNLLAAFYLWQMRPIATILFATEGMVQVLSGFYLAFVDPSQRMLTLRANHHETTLYLLVTAFEVALTVYVWRVTGPLRPSGLSRSQRVAA
jgi:hypothetical protein